MTDNLFRRILKAILYNTSGEELPFDTVGLSVKNFMLEVQKGNVPGHSAINKFGHNPSITTATDPEDVWSAGGLYLFYPTTAQAMEAVSSDDEDGGAGTDTGALSIMVFGLDSNWDLQSETVILNGTAPVALSNTYIRMYRAVALTAGSHETNVGDISIQISGGGTVGAYIAADDGKTQQAIYTIPNGKTGYFLKGYVGISKGAGAVTISADFKWKAKANNGVDGAWTTEGQIECMSSGSSWWQYEYGVPNGPIPEKTDIRLECVEVSATVGVVGGYDFILVDDGF